MGDEDGADGNGTMVVLEMTVIMNGGQSFLIYHFLFPDTTNITQNSFQIYENLKRPRRSTFSMAIIRRCSAVRKRTIVTL
jgi:hypothetical protein